MKHESYTYTDMNMKSHTKMIFKNNYQWISNHTTTHKIILRYTFTQKKIQKLKSETTPTHTQARVRAHTHTHTHTQQNRSNINDQWWG